MKKNEMQEGLSRENYIELQSRSYKGEITCIERVNSMRKPEDKSSTLTVDSLTFSALTAFFGRIDLDTMKDVLRRRYLSETLSEKQIDDFCCALTLFYSEQFNPVTARTLAEEFPEFVNPPF